MDNLLSEMESFLKAVARKSPSPSHPIHLRFEHKNNLKVTDRQKRNFSVDESTLSSYRDIYTDKACTPAPTQTRASVCTIGNSKLTSRARPARRSP